VRAAITAGLRTPEGLAMAAAAGSALLLLLALGFQYLGGLHPCVLCVWQRWPHVVAALAGLWVWARRAHPDRMLAVVVGTAACAVGVTLGGLHTGVELGLWPSPVGCAIPDWSDPHLAQTLATTTPADCSVPAWSFLGHSMAAWNTLFTSVLVGIWAGAAGRMLRTGHTGRA